jgi:hypothetical protein
MQQKDGGEGVWREMLEELQEAVEWNLPSCLMGWKAIWRCATYWMLYQRYMAGLFCLLAGRLEFSHHLVVHF